VALLSRIPYPLLSLKPQHYLIDEVFGEFFLEILGQSGIAYMGFAIPRIGIDPEPNQDRVILKPQQTVQVGSFT